MSALRISFGGDEKQEEHVVGQQKYVQELVIIEEGISEDEDDEEIVEREIVLNSRIRAATAIQIEESDDDEEQPNTAEGGDVVRAPPPPEKNQSRFMCAVHEDVPVLICTSLRETRDKDLENIYQFVLSKGDEFAIRVFNVMEKDDLPDEMFPEELVCRDFLFHRGNILHFSALCAFTKTIGLYLKRGNSNNNNKKEHGHSGKTHQGDEAKISHVAVVVCDQDEVACWLSLVLLLYNGVVDTALSAVALVKQPKTPAWAAWINNGGWNATHTTYLNFFVKYCAAKQPFNFDQDPPAITINAFELSVVHSELKNDLYVYCVMWDGDGHQIYRKQYSLDNKSSVRPSHSSSQTLAWEPWSSPYSEPHTLSLRSRVSGDVHVAIFSSPDGTERSSKTEGELLALFSFHTSFLDDGAKDTLHFSDARIHNVKPGLKMTAKALFSPISELERSKSHNEKKTETWKSLTNAIRGLVSKKKLRFQREGFDLDLSYITENIIAMGFPSESVESLYRNKMTDVQRFFTKFHPDQFKVYNLCSERKYSAERFDHMVGYFPFDDHNPPPFALLPKICQDIVEFLDQDPDNVVAIHCKAGKGRTGTVIASLLLYQHVAVRAKDALTFFGEARTSNGAGVTIPSQQRYVRYMERYLSEYDNAGRSFPYYNTPVEIKGFKLFGEVKGLGGEIAPMFIISSDSGEVLYQSEATQKYKATPGDKVPWCRLECSAFVDGDFKVTFYHRYKSEKLCSFWLHSSFLMPSNFSEDMTGDEEEAKKILQSKLVLRIKRSGLDYVANKDKKFKKFAKDFSVEMSYAVLFGTKRQEIFEQFEKKRIEKLNSLDGTRKVGKGLTGKIRGLVSKKKLRFQGDGYDLDLSYITDRVIAMGFPSKSFEGLYRNNVRDVQRFFFDRHSAHYKVYNLCSERAYDSKKFHLVCQDFKFDDHNPCPFDMIPLLCEDVNEFLCASDSNVVAIHCKAGKGRTGLMISCLLLHTREHTTADEALQHFAIKRTSNGKGVTIPSQIRYVHYYQTYLDHNLSHPSSSFPKNQNLILTGMRLSRAIAWNFSGDSDPYYVVYRNQKKSKYSYIKQHGDLGVKTWTKQELYCDLRIHCLVQNDFKIVLFDRDMIGADDKMCWFWLNTNFLLSEIDPETKTGKLTLTKKEIDGAIKDKSDSIFHPEFTIELTFTSVVDGYEEKSERGDKTNKAVMVGDQVVLPPPSPSSAQQRKSLVLNEIKQGSNTTQGQKYRRSVLLNDIKGSSHGSGLLATVRGVVSKKKRRFQRDGFDLDLTYILPNVIAMGAPSTSLSGLYRNNMRDVQHFFNSYHGGNYKILNLCAEYQYDASLFDGSVAVFPFQDHNPPKFEDLVKICEDMDEYTTDDDDNTVAVHCKAGKGRTGTVIACHLLFQRFREEAADALQYFGLKRTTDGHGVTIPSQARYVQYFQDYLKHYRWKDLPFNFKGPAIKIQNVRLTSPPSGGMSPYFVLEGPSTTKHKEILYNMKKDPFRRFKVQEWRKKRQHDIECDINAQGDFKMVIYDKAEGFGDDQKVCWFWLHTAFLTQNGRHSVLFTKRMLDGAVKDKQNRKTPIDFSVELFYAYDAKHVRVDLDERLLRAKRNSVTYCKSSNDVSRSLQAVPESDELVAMLQTDEVLSDEESKIGYIEEEDDDGDIDGKFSSSSSSSIFGGYQKKVMLKEGYGFKRGKGVMASWQKRYFVLFDQMLVYYKSMEDYRRGQVEPLGTVPMSLVRNVVKHKEKDLIISLVAAEEYKNKESLRLRCLNFVLRDQWVDEMKALVTFDSPDCEGFVRKQHKDVSRIWQKRYLRLDSKKGTLEYSESKTSSPNGVIPLKHVVGCNKCRMPGGPHLKVTKKVRCRFEVHVADNDTLRAQQRTYTFWTETSFLAAEWVRKLIASAPQLQQASS